MILDAAARLSIGVGLPPDQKAAAMGRRLTKPRDVTMRYIARKNLWDAVAAQCGISSTAVRLWLQVPPLRVRDVERAIGRPRRLIRPDLYPEKANPKRSNHGQKSQRGSELASR